MLTQSAFLSFVILLLLVIVPLAVASIVLSQQPSQCDHVDVGVNLSVGQWLLGYGIFSLVSTFSVCFLLWFFLHTQAIVWFYMLISISFLASLFGIAWFIVGGVVLFRSNLDCIRSGAPTVVFALAMWCLMALTVVVNVYQGARKSSRQVDVDIDYDF